MVCISVFILYKINQFKRNEYYIQYREQNYILLLIEFSFLILFPVEMQL